MDIMTKEEALTLWLPVIKMGVKDMPECNEALDMATKALERETKTGHWVDWDDGFSACECSECKNAEFIKSKYCPNCGIKMDNPLEREE